MTRRRRDTPPPDPGSSHLAALRLLGRRDYTSAELRSRLIEKRHDADEVEATIVRLRADGWLNDQRVALAHVRTAANLKGRGPLRIRRELEARGLDAATVRQSTETVSDEDVETAIRRFLSRKRLPSPIPLDQRQRLFQQLLRRGFPAAAIGKALKTPFDTED